MATEYRPAPNAEVGGRNIDPEEEGIVRPSSTEVAFIYEFS